MTSREADYHKESVRCMSKVFDDIANMLQLPPEQYGDPDALMDAIEALQACEAQSAARIAQLEGALHMMDEIEPTEDRVFKEHETFCSLVEPSSWEMVDGVKKILSYKKTHIVFHKSAMSDKRGLQILRFTKQVDDTHWSFAGTPWSGVYLTPNEWAIVMRKALVTADKIAKE